MSGSSTAGAIEAPLDIAGVRCDDLHEPQDLAACAELVTRASRDRLRLTFLGGGTALGLGNAPIGVDAAVSTRRLDRILEYAPEDQVIVAEAGVLLSDLQALAARHGQWLGVDAPHATRATLGGLVSVGAFGPRRARYGSVKDLLLGVTLLRADGVIAKGGSKVVKNVAGFDLPKVICGSLGTLGLVAGVTLRLHPLPEASATVLTTESAAAGVVELVRVSRLAQLEPSSVVALRTDGGRYELGVRFEGFAPGVARDVARFVKAADECAIGGHTSSPADADRFWERHQAVRQEGDLRFRFQALPTDLSRVDASLEALFAALEQPQFAWYATLGIGFGSGRVSSCEAVLVALRAARAGALRGRGALIVDAAPAGVRRAFDAWGPEPGGFAIMRELKQRFDPQRRLNPGRFVGGI